MEKEVMNNNEVAELLVKLYSDYARYACRLGYTNSINNKYSEAVAKAIRALKD